METDIARCRISLRNTVQFRGEEFQLPAQPFAAWIGRTVETHWPASADHFIVRGLDGAYYDVSRVRLIVTDRSHVYVALPSGGTATVAENVSTQTLYALDAMMRAARAGLQSRVPASARRTKYMRLRRFLSRHFERERINGGRRCPTNLFRWEHSPTEPH